MAEQDKEQKMQSEKMPVDCAAPEAGEGEGADPMFGDSEQGSEQGEEGGTPQAETNGETDGDQSGLHGDAQPAAPREVPNHQLGEDVSTPATEDSFVRRGDLDHAVPVDLGDENLPMHHAKLGRDAQEQNDPELQKQMGQEALDSLETLRRSQRIADSMARGTFPEKQEGEAEEGDKE